MELESSLSTLIFRSQPHLSASKRKSMNILSPLKNGLVVRKETTTKQVWDAVVKHHQQKAQLIIVELRRKLAKLRQMREDLAMMGEVVTDDNFRSIILSSLPGSFDTFLTSAARDNCFPTEDQPG
jgi:hypothetical protein